MKGPEVSNIAFASPKNFELLQKIYFGVKVDAMSKSGVMFSKGNLNNFRLRAPDFNLKSSTFNPTINESLVKTKSRYQ